MRILCSITGARTYGTVWVSGNNIAPGDKIGPLKVTWDTETPGDYWYASIVVPGGSHPAMYVSHNPDDPLLPYWKECLLIHDYFDDSKDDDGSHPTFTVDWNTFSINLKSGACSASMLNVGNHSPVWNVFVLMLENHSFDNIFAFSGISGITAATTANSNVCDGTTYKVSDAATPTSMTTDPGHEFSDVLQQLCGYGPNTKYWSPNYPKIDLSGFAATYANSADEHTGKPAVNHIGDVMACFNTQSQLPNICTLAKKYVLCDHWFSSLPGPTWPNRFYVHGASSAFWNPLGPYYWSLDDSPSDPEMAIWEAADGFAYQNGSIFDRLNQASIPWRIYHDTSGAVSGSVPQVTSLKNISLVDVLSVKSLSDMQADLKSAYPYRYTFIEPNYGDVVSDSYVGGSSQHPKDDVSGGENLIANVFTSISQSPLWQHSLLIITYDEHGGFYDSVVPGPTVAPNTADRPGENGFVFNQLGVRVPAVIVSPLLANPGQVDHTVYDHSSVLSTITDLFGLRFLTARDGSANNLTHLLSGAGEMPSGDVLHLSVGQPPSSQPAMTPEDLAARALEPLPEKGNLRGTLAVARKTDIDLSSGTPAERAAIHARVSALQTRGDADAYIKEVMGKVQARRAAHAAAVKAELNKPGSKSAMKQTPPPEQSK